MRKFLENVEKGFEDEDALNPLKSAQQAMRPQLPKRFYKKVSVEEGEGGFSVQLDGRAVKTPARQTVVVPTKAAAELLRDEWERQETEIDPAAMPAARIVNTALDGVASDPQAVLEDMIKFAGTDLLCYRADGPGGLVERQTEIWDPILDWAQASFGARFSLIEGIMPQAQPKEAIAAYGGRIRNFHSPIQIACLHTMTTLTGSAILALAAAEEELSLDETWRAAHVDEDWNIELWGEDHEAMRRREKRFMEMKAAHALFFAVGSSGV